MEQETGARRRRLAVGGLLHELFGRIPDHLHRAVPAQPNVHTEADIGPRRADVERHLDRLPVQARLG